jgi:hypothetical protein
METLSDKTIKKIALAFVTVVIVALLVFTYFQSTKLSGEGKIAVKNGKGERVNVRYHILNREILKEYSKSDFSKVINYASEQAKNSCNYEPTYEPLQFTIYGDFETLAVNVSFSAENGFGVPDELSESYLFEGTEYMR